MEASDDAIADLRPLCDFRAKMIAKEPKVAAEAVRAAVNLWDKITNDVYLRGGWGLYEDPSKGEYIQGKPDFVVPSVSAFRELTQLIAWWCDQGKFSIDPAPLTDCAMHAEWAAIFATPNRMMSDVERAKREFKKFVEHFHRCDLILDRIRYAISVTIGEEPEVPPTRRRGRPLGSGQWPDIVEELERGTDPADVATMFDVTTEYVQDLKRRNAAKSLPNLVKSPE